MFRNFKFIQSVFIILALSFTILASTKWTEQQANEWYAKQPYLVGANFVPATAINQLEMWQAETFDEKRIDLELGWAASLGMNTMRVFLHDLAYSQDPAGFKKRLNRFLAIADKHKIKPMIVFFDSVWNPQPQIGKQPAPKSGVHNSGWVQSPSAKTLQNPAEYQRLEKYVKDIVGTHAKDSRINSWDLWNEPDNRNGHENAKNDAPNKIELVNKLLPLVFAWARAANPSQPLTSGVWKGDYPNKQIFDSTEQIQMDNSDIVTFHSYDSPEEVEKRIKFLQKFNRPVICTEYMARPRGNTFVGVLPLMKKYNVGAINWGFVEGKSQTNYPWDSWDKPYVEYQPWIWFHDILRTDGTPYLREETDLIKRITGKTKAMQAGKN